MEINVFYEPMRLIKQKNLIESEHKGKIDYENPPEGFISKKIKEIMTISDSKLDGYSDLLKDYELQYLAYYLPKEKDRAVNQKIKKILLHRSSQEIMDCYYISWQNYFDSIPDNYNSQTLNDLSENGKFLKIYNIDHQDMDSMFNKSPHLVLASKISDYCLNTNSEFDNTMHEIFKIKKYTRLGKKIIKTRYLYCSAKELLKVNEGFLCDIANEYDTDDKIHFFVNFVSKMDTKRLSEYLDLEKIAERYLGPKTERYNKLPKKVQSLLSAWFSSKQIFDIFGEDERGVYWRARALECKAQNAVLYKHYGLAMITFENFVVTEFLMQSDGPMYIMPKDIYQNTFLKIFNRHLDKTDFKSALYHEFDGTIYRIVHRWNWRETAYDLIVELL